MTGVALSGHYNFTSERASAAAAPIASGDVPCGAVMLVTWKQDKGIHRGFKGALQLLLNRYVEIHFAQVPERVLNEVFVILVLENSKSNHLGAQGTFEKLGS